MSWHLPCRQNIKSASGLELQILRITGQSPRDNYENCSSKYADAAVNTTNIRVGSPAAFIHFTLKYRVCPVFAVQFSVLRMSALIFSHGYCSSNVKVSLESKIVGSVFFDSQFNKNTTGRGVHVHKHTCHEQCTLGKQNMELKLIGLSEGELSMCVQDRYDKSNRKS